MALLLETNLGDLVIDLDIEGSPEICKNVLKLAKARYYTSSLVYNVQPHRFCQLGDPQGNGTGGTSIYGLISALEEDGEINNQRVLLNPRRFLKSSMGRPLTPEECQQKGRVVATEMKGISDTIGSQLLITTFSGKDMALDGFRSVDTGDDRQLFRSIGVVTEDSDKVLDRIGEAYCDASGRPYADIRILRALIIDDPYDDPPGMDRLLKARGVEMDEDDKVTMSPEYERPLEEKVEIRISADQIDPVTGEEDLEKLRQQEEEQLKREDKSRAVVLEMLGDLPDAEMTAPENVLFICKLNPVTEDEDLELIFSRFDEKVKAEIIRDHDSGTSLQYAFVEFTSKEQAAEAYFKMNNALVDDRRIKVDFSQSVAKVWNKFSQRTRKSSGNHSNQHMPKNPFTELRGPDKRQREGPRQNNSYVPGYANNRSRDTNIGRHAMARVEQHPRSQVDMLEVDSFGRQRRVHERTAPSYSNHRGMKNGDPWVEHKEYRHRRHEDDSKRHNNHERESQGREKRKDENSERRRSNHRERDRQRDLSSSDSERYEKRRRHGKKRKRERRSRDRSDRRRDRSRSESEDSSRRKHGKREKSRSDKHQREDESRQRRRRHRDRKHSNRDR